MAYTVVHNGVVFVEGECPQAVVIAPVKADLSFRFGAQLKNLNHVKDELVQKAKAAGGNCIKNFEYGQKSRWLAVDDVAFWGKGVCCLIPEPSYSEIVEKHSVK